MCVIRALGVWRWLELECRWWPVTDHNRPSHHPYACLPAQHVCKALQQVVESSIKSAAEVDRAWGGNGEGWVKFEPCPCAHWRLPTVRIICCYQQVAVCAWCSWPRVMAAMNCEVDPIATCWPKYRARCPFAPWGRQTCAIAGNDVMQCSFSTDVHTSLYDFAGPFVWCLHLCFARSCPLDFLLITPRKRLHGFKTRCSLGSGPGSARQRFRYSWKHRVRVHST